MVKKILISNQKGGVGKTTVTCNLAVGLAMKGYRVGVLDTDPQGHCSLQFGVLDEQGKPYEALFNLIINAKKFNLTMEDLTFDVSPKRGEWSGSIRLLPGGKETALAAFGMQMRGAKFHELTALLEPFTSECDYVLCDTSPTVSLLTPSLMAWADYVLIPTDGAALDVSGVHEVMYTMIQAAGNHDAKLLGILPTKSHPTTKEDNTQLARLLEWYPGYVWDDVQLTYSTIWKQASDVAASIFEWAEESHPAYQQMSALVDKVALTTMGVEYDLSA